MNDDNRQDIERVLWWIVGAIMAGLIVWAGLVALRQYRAIGGVRTLLPTATATALPPTSTATRPPATSTATATPTPEATATPDPARAALAELCAADKLAQDRAAIGYIEEAQGIHQQWITYIEQNPGLAPAQVGGIPWHQGWVAKYDQVLAPLRAYLDACALLTSR